MRKLLGDDGNFTCPILTKPVYCEEGDQHGCIYTSWAYGLFAVVAIIIVGIPFVGFICYIHRKIRNKKRNKELASQLRREISDPYQPLLFERGEYSSSGYGAAVHSVEEDPAIRSPLSLESEVPTDRLYQQQDTVSATSSHASVIPNFDEASLKLRNAKADHTCLPSTSESQSCGGGRGKLPCLSVDSQGNPVDQRGPLYDSVDVVSNIPTLMGQSKKNENPLPPESPQQFAEDYKTASPMYAILEGPEAVAGTSYGDLQGSQSSQINGTSEDSERTLQKTPEYAVLEPPVTQDVSVENSRTHEQNSRSQHGQFDKEVEPSLIPENQGLNPATKESGNASYEQDSQRGSPSNEKYITVLPSENNEVENESNMQESMANSDKVLATSTNSKLSSREDYEEFLLEKAQALPANKRNGIFLIRDSFSSSGLKVLTMYCRMSDSNKELYNFKICFTEKRQAYLYSSSRKFSDLHSLLEYLREHKHMLPCVLATQVFPT